MVNPTEITVTERQRAILERWAKNNESPPHRLGERSKIVLMSAEGRNNRQQARQLGVDRQRIRRWRYRWADAEKRLLEAEKNGANDEDLSALIIEVLSNDRRPKRQTQVQC